MKLKITSFVDKDTRMPYLVYSKRKLKGEGKIIGSSWYSYEGVLYPYVVMGNGVGMTVIDDESNDITIYNNTQPQAP